MVHNVVTGCPCLDMAT